MDKEKMVCNYPWTHFEVNNPNGDVTFCCDNNTVLGNVNNQTIAEIWNGKKYQLIRERMLKEGAKSICFASCPVLQGFKSYQKLDWFKALPKTSPVYLNALKNEEEIREKKLILQSLPRWMRFAYSYVCNIDCYHCYQSEIRKENKTLSQNFINELFSLTKVFQVLCFYGGEPFLYKPTTELLERDINNRFCRYFFVTNGTLLNERILSRLCEIPIGFVAVSLDAATRETYNLLRKDSNWDKVMSNLQGIAGLRRKKEFMFAIAMTVNTKNAGEIGKFVDLAIKFGAQPFILLVSNPFGTYSFQKEYLHFSDQQFSGIFSQIEDCLFKLKEKSFSDAYIALNFLKVTLQKHKAGKNNLFKFALESNIRKAHDKLPVPLKSILKSHYKRWRALEHSENIRV